MDFLTMSLPTRVCFWFLNMVVTLLSIQGQKALNYPFKYINSWSHVVVVAAVISEAV